MASMNPVLRLRRAFRSMGADEEQAEVAATAIQEEFVGQSFFDSTVREQTITLQNEFQQAISDLRQEMAEMRNQMMVTILVATGLILTAIIGAVSIAVAILD